MPFNQQCLHQLLRYDPATGILTWAVPMRDRRGQTLGERADTSNGDYRGIEICGLRFLAHRVIWFFVTGRWPSDMIDHADGDGHNNRWTNLRDASNEQNQGNRRAQTSGLKGIYLDRRRGKWRANITDSGRSVKLGSFDCPAAAHFTYLVAADKKFGPFARAR